MKTASASLAAHLAGEVTTLCTCWKLSRLDGVVMGFTDHDADVTFDGVTFKAATGSTPTAIASSADLAVDNLEVEVMLDDAGITEADLRANVYDFAEVEVLLVNWAEPAGGALVLGRGHLGEVKIGGLIATAEVRGLVQALATNLGELFSADCRAALGDARCRIDLAALTVAGIVGTVASRRQFTPANAGPVVELALPNRTVVEGVPFTHQIAATAFFDPDGEALTFTATLSDGSPLPAWLGFNATTLTFSGTAPAGAASLTCRVTATDGRGGSGYGDFLLVVVAAGGNTAPVVAKTLGNQRVLQAQAFSFPLSPATFYDADGDALSYTASFTSAAATPPWIAFSALPSWIAFNPATLTFSGTAPLDGPVDGNGVSQPNRYLIRLTAADGRGASAYGDFLLIVTTTGDAGPPLPGYYSGGVVAFTSGACTGIKAEVKAYDGGAITLFLPMPREIAIGDAYTIHPGCDRTAASCRERYNNLDNFRGEPFVPGQDKCLEYPNAATG